MKYLRTNHIGSEALFVIRFVSGKSSAALPGSVADLLRVHIIRLADEADGVRQQNVTLCFLFGTLLPNSVDAGNLSISVFAHIHRPV